MEKHVLNERLKRIEPLETLCQFCNSKHSTNMNLNYFVPLFKEQDRTNLVVYSSVKFKQISVGIPRCAYCYKIHSETKVKTWAISLLAGAILTVMGFYMWGPYGVFSFIGFFMAALLTPMFITDVIIKKKGILPPQEGAKKDVLVQDFVISGWSLTQPSPR
ncbi:hypothetical protein [Sporocytophaga myxococcoides]|uniref:hypothetical protein n=1 Tax=Sporocytophaga myxococcoides TaxID=153721 RepID=UPI00048ACF23|nr:hypothetical protein [Sporocytophaga myxococcoides]